MALSKSAETILIAVAASAAAAATAAIVTHYLTKQAVTKDIASGNTPLPSGSTPTTMLPQPNLPSVAQGQTSQSTWLTDVQSGLTP